MPKIKQFAKQYDLDVDFIGNKIYVRTDVGCWKIIYKKNKQAFILQHRNYVTGRIELGEVEKALYHRQTDMSESGSIMKYLKYIQSHDEFKQKLPSDAT